MCINNLLITTKLQEVEGKVYNVLLFIKGGWMVDEQVRLTCLSSNILTHGHTQGGRDDPARHKQMKLLRQLCLPKLCFLLHNVLHSTQNYKKVCCSYSLSFIGQLVFSVFSYLMC